MAKSKPDKKALIISVIFVFTALLVIVWSLFDLPPGSAAISIKKSPKAWAMTEKTYLSPGQDYIITINRMPIDRISSKYQYCEVFFGNKKNRMLQLVDDFMLWDGNINVIFSPSGSRFAINIQETKDSKNFKLYDVPGRMTREIPVSFPEIDRMSGVGNYDSWQMSVLKWIDNDRLAVQLKAWRGLPAKKPDLSKEYTYSVRSGYIVK